MDIEGKTVEFDLAEVLGGNVESVISKLPDMTDDQLIKLAELEFVDKKRSTLFAAMDAEIAKRAAEEGARSEGASDAAGDEPKPLSFSKEAVDKLLSEQATRLSETHSAEIAKLKAQLPKASKPAGAPKPLRMSGKGEALDAAALGGVTQIVLVDEEDMALPGLPALSFVPDSYRASAGRLILDADISFPQTLPARDVAGAFVLDGKGHAVGVARLVAPFRVGGGNNAVLQRNTLSFEGYSEAA
jgi:hypothetical protein